MPHESPSWKLITGDDRAVIGPARFIGLILSAELAATSAATVYDGQDSGGRRFALFRVQTGRCIAFDIPGHPILGGGIFVDRDSSDGTVTVMYEAVGSS